MAVNPRFEISSTNPDGVTYGHPNMHRGQFLGGSNLERGSGCRDNHDGRLVVHGVTGASFSGSGHGELRPLSDVLSLHTISSGEQKYARQLDLRRAINAVVGMAGEEQMHGSMQAKLLEQQGPEELRRIRASLSDNVVRAKKRSRELSEAISMLDNYRASTQTRKRVRSEVSAHERPIAPLSVERPTITGNSTKASFCASPNHVNISDGVTLKSEDKSKGVVPNKRVRTSMVDVRLEGRTNTSSFQRSSGLADRDRDSFKSTSSLAVSVEDKDRIVSAGSEGWEKAKMKGRRSGNKSDSVLVTPANATLEVEREHKWGSQHRNNAENRSRPSEGHGFRSGPVHGVAFVHKGESGQQNGVAMRSVNRNESDGSPSVGEKGDRFVLPEKERPLSKNGVKLSHKEEGPLLSRITHTKAKAARAPRSSVAIAVNHSVHASRPPSADVWDRPPSRAQLPVGPTNRKRPAPSRSSSPPVAQWVRQRPQKMARIARRMHVVPPLSPVVGRDEAVSMGEGNCIRDGIVSVGARSNPSTSASAGFPRRVASAAILPQNKPKAERLTPSIGLSESEGSEGGDVKSREKGKKHVEAEGRFAAVSQKMGPLVLPCKKSRVGPKEEVGDGVRRQGRSGRGLIAFRESSTITQVEKMDASANAKQLRSARPGIEKLENPVDMKPVRPPTKKMAGDRKPLTRPRRPAASCTGDISGESDDDHEELADSVHAAVNASALACPNDFWRQMEPYFAYLTPDQLEKLRKQVRESEEADVSLGLVGSNEKIDTKLATPPEAPVVKRACNVANLANGSMEADGAVISKVLNSLKEKQPVGMDGKNTLHGGWSDRGFPLSQRLLAALIIESDSGDDRKEDGIKDELQSSARDGSSSDLSESEEGGLEKEQDFKFEVEARRGDSRKVNGSVNSPFREGSCTSNGNTHCVSITALHKFDKPKEQDIFIYPETNHLYCSKIETRDEDAKQVPTYFTDSFSLVCGLSSWDVHYQSLKLDERIMLELQSVGLYPDLSDADANEDDEIVEELQKSHIELKDQVHVNKERLTHLERSVSNSRAKEKREREQLVMVKLLEFAFKRRMGCHGGVVGASGSKSSASKAARAAALTFTKRTLARWRHFVESGQSCVIDGSLKDILFCVPSKDGEMKALTNSSEAFAGINAVTQGPLELNSTVLEGTGRSGLCHMYGSEKADEESLEVGQIAATFSEYVADKDDIWCSRPREREAFLEDVVGSGIIGNTVVAGTKGKRSERERDGKNLCKEITGRSENKGGRQGIATIKGERKNKTKPRQKTAPLSKAVNGLLAKPAELLHETAPVLPVSLDESADRCAKAKDVTMSMDLGSVGEAKLEAEATLDLSRLQIPSMDDLVVNGDLEGQGQDLGSWLDFEDPALPDAGGDFMGLDVPMDDLADLAMMM